VRKLFIALVLTTALVVVAAAAAVLPRAGVRYNGLTNAKKVNGFGDNVTFLIGSRSLKGFSFGTLGCFGYGSFPVGVDPYATSLALIKPVPVAATGTFAITSAPATWSGGDPATTLLVTVNGKFSADKSAIGTITITEKTHGDSCVAKMTFTAKQGALPPTS
jgi:hypothetical protein